MKPKYAVYETSDGFFFIGVEGVTYCSGLNVKNTIAEVWHKDNAQLICDALNSYEV